MYKKVIAVILMIALSFSIVSPAFAYEITDFSEEALRVSDEFVKAYPNGAFSLSSVEVQTNEYSGRLDMNVIRQGGSAGNATVTVKAIDISAKIGQDYKLSIPGLLFDKQISGNTTGTILESGQTGLTTSSTSVSNSVYENVYNNTAQTETIKIESGGLRSIKEKVAGQTSDREKLGIPSNEENEQLNTALTAAKDYYAELPGTVFTLSFADGERLKKFNLDIINDSLPEAEEQIVFVITNVTGGGFVGLQKETTVNIVDDEAYEMPVIGFSANSYAAGSDTAKITVTRTKGIYYYAGATLSTVGDSAIAGIDYTELGQKILFAPGQTELSFEIPIVKNESSVDKYFYVKLEPDNSCTVSGNNSVKVLLSKKVNETAQINTLTAGADNIEPLGTKSVTLDYDDYDFIGQDGLQYGYNNGGWYEILIKGDNQNGRMCTKESYYISQLDSIKTNIELYKLKCENHFDVWIDGYLRKALTKNDFKKYINSIVLNKNLVYGRNKNDVGKELLARPIYDRKTDTVKSTNPVNIELAVRNGRKDYAAMRVYSINVNYRYYEFAVQKAPETTEYTFDFSKTDGYYTATTISSPGEVDITTTDDKPVKGFYTSQDYTFKVNTKILKDGYYLKELRFFKVKDPESKEYCTYDMSNNTGTITLDHKWLYSNGDYYINEGGVNKFYIQPIFDRHKSTLTVSIPDKDKGKGEISGVVNSDKTEATYKTVVVDGKPYDLLEGDKVTLTGVGYNNYAVSGYYVTVSDGSITGPQSEAGLQNAGIYTVTLKNNISVSPIFGARQLNIKRDPSNLETYPDIQGTITYGEQTQTKDGKIDGISSGQVVDFISIPPEGYTTMWANRTGDTNNDGVLDDSEYNDPETGYPYRMYDYDGDHRVDVEYGEPIYGDLFSYKVNQPNPIFYYYYEKLGTPYTGQVSGHVFTYKYDIYHGFTEDDKGNKKLIPVEGATVRMGGSYDRSNPDAQMGYGASTDNVGKFVFNVTNVQKSKNYILGIDYDGISYLDKINTSLAKQVILPVFTSMKPVKINAIPEGGENKSIVSGSVVMIKDKKVDFVLETESLENNVLVDKVNYKIYSSSGILLSENVETVTNHNAVFTANLNNAFIPNAKIKVQLIDQFGNKSREYDTGFQFRPKIMASSLLPSFAAPKVKDIPIIGSVMGAIDMGVADTGIDSGNIAVNEEEYTIYLGIGKQFDTISKELINTIDEAEDENKNEADKKKAKEKVSEENKSAPEKKDSNVKVKSTLTNDLNIKVSLEMNIKYDPDRDTSLGSPYYFGQLKLLVTMEDSFSSETRVVLPVGLSVVLKLDVGGKVTGYICIKPVKDFDMNYIKVYADDNGNFPYTNNNIINPSNYKFKVDGGIILEPSIKLTVSGEYGIAEVSVSGSALFNLIFTTDHKDRGTVTLNASIKVTALGFEVYKKSFGDWSTSLFGSTSSLLSEALDSESLNQSKFVPMSRDYLNNRSSWLGNAPNLQSSFNGSDYTEKSLLSGIYPYPDTQLMRIDEDSLLMVFVDDNAERSEENRGAIYYCISHDNGSTFSQPVMLSNDGTLDSHPRLSNLGDKILCLYSSMDGLILDDMSMEEILEANGLEMAFFDKSTCEFSKPVDVTRYTARVNPNLEGSLLGDYYSDENGNAVYDAATGQVLIIYTKSDYTSDADRNLSAEDLFGNYSTIAYMIYDTKTGSFLPYSESDYPQGLTSEEKAQWDKDWYGQRFLNTEIVDANLPGGKLSDPMIFDLNASIKGSTAYIAYTVDMDGSMETMDDREIYLKTYSFTDKTFSKPIKISDLKEGESAKSDGKPQLVLYNGEMYLFFNANTAIHYYNLDDLLAQLSSSDSFISPGIALEYNEENLPTDDYKVLVGDDGKLYLIWTEETVRLAEGIKPGSQESLMPENSYHEDQIYASVFYQDSSKDLDQFEGDYSNTNNIYGRWSSKVKITEGPGSYGDISASVMANGNIIIAAKKSDKILADASDTSPRVDNPNSMQLVALTLTPVTQGEMKEDAITITPEYPMPNELVNITTKIGNHGLMPLLNPTVDFYSVEGDIETLIGTANSIEHVYGGCEATLGIEWTAPKNIQNIKIIAKLRSGDDATVIPQAEKEFPYGINLTYSLFNIDYIAQNSYRAYIEVHHTGNQPLTGAKLVINRIDDENNSHLIKSVELDDTIEADEMFVVDECFELSNADLKDYNANIEVRIEKDGKLLVKQTGNVVKDIAEMYKDLTNDVSGINLPKNMYMSLGGKNSITADIYPAEAVQRNRIVYVSSNPKVAEVNSNGEITAVSVGSAVITAYAVPKVEVSKQTIDSHSLDGDILDSLALEDCVSNIMNVTVNEDYSEPISVNPVIEPKNDVITDGNTISIIAKAVLDSAGKAEASISDIKVNEAVAKILEESAKEGKTDAQGFNIKVEAPEAAKSVHTNIPITALRKIEQSDINGLTLLSPLASIAFDKKSLKTLTDEALQDVKITASRLDTSTLSDDVRKAVGDNPVFDFSVTSGDKTISEFSGSVTVSIPYNPKEKEDINAIVIYYISDDGKLNMVSNCSYNPETKTVTFNTNHFSKYFIGYNKVNFNDVANRAWYKDAVTFIAARGITSGTGEGIYSPEAELTRGQFITMLLKTYGIKPDQNSADNFSDCGKTYYSGYLAAAKRLGISNGTGNNMFEPDNTITRQEMFTLLYNALKAIGKLPQDKTGKSLSEYSDAVQTATWARDAITLLVSSGVINGSDGKLNPTANVNRAQMAQVLYNLLSRR